MGFWLCLQNCHLSLSFCEEIMQTVIDSEEIHANFRYSNNPTYDPIKLHILILNVIKDHFSFQSLAHN